MNEQLLDRLSDLIAGAFSLSQSSFQKIVHLPEGQTIALLVVLAAGLSLAVGQSVILVVNRVKPLRFVFSLLLSAILYACGFLFLVFSTWLIGWLPGFVQISWSDLVKDLGLSYAPLLFGFLAALPYAGVPILNVLSAWHLLAMVAGISAIAEVSGAQAFVRVVFGWGALQLLQGSLGQPIAKLGRQLAERVAGVNLASTPAELKEIVLSDLETRLTAIGADRLLKKTTRDRQVPSTPRSPSTQTTDATTKATADLAALELPSVKVNGLGMWLAHRWQGIHQMMQLGSILLGMLLLFLIVAILLRPIYQSMFGWHESLPRLVQRTIDLTWIGVLAIVFAGFLAPLEALGWWSGWYDDDVDIHSADSASRPVDRSVAERFSSRSDRPSRYIVYLDGVGQSGQAYTPDVAEFIEALQAVLPKDVVFVRGLMMYSVFNKPLNQDRPLAWIWRLADKVRWQNPTALLGMVLNLRNVLIVGVSADKRYGPIYNQGIAQVLYNGLVRHGYQPQECVPITLIGYSGGGQMAVAAAPYLRRVLGSQIEAISLGGVMSANNNLLKLEHLYHLVGDLDGVARLGPILFPGRWKLFPLSYWNRAMRKGKISEISLGPMGHQVPGGMMDPDALLPNGQSHLQHTIAAISSILGGRLLVANPYRSRQVSNYELYKQADFNHYTYYPLAQTVDARWYRPIAPWMGRLILPLPEERHQVRGVWFEVHHADRGHEDLVGQRVMLRWADLPRVKDLVRAVTRDVHFSVDAEYSSQYGNSIHPQRLNHWQRVGPLESLAGSHPTDDAIVMLTGTVDVERSSASDRESEGGASSHPLTALYVRDQPVEITGRYYALVRFEAPIAGTDRFQVRHFSPSSRQFNGWEEVVRLPPVILAKAYGSYPSTTHNLEQNPLNEAGWYVYGAKDAAGIFVVQSLAPRSLFRLQPDRVVFGSKSSYRYIRREAWANTAAQKGKISSVLCVGNRHAEDIQSAIDEWKVGDRALLLHVYGGIGGTRKEPAAAAPIFFGHFAYGLATVIRDPIGDELRFEIQYYQVYAHNLDGLTAGTLHWSRYMGDRQFGWLGNRPTCDILIEFEPFTGFFDTNDGRRSALSNMLSHLEAMTARYRIGDGTGATYVGPANNCAQDSNQALFASIRSLFASIATNQSPLQTWLANNPEQSRRYQQLLEVQTKLNQQLHPLGVPRTDWQNNEFNLGTSLEDEPLRNLWTGLGSWRTLLPRKASDTIVRVFLEQGASVWVLRTNQIGGHDPDIEPIAPMTF
ncbi:hypothetical protein [Pseudanabaena sp. PCC 6802]|uniref:hypothetical protein n=1 Tax=Pseudanabaena sp. PCC 6802 TaxID=118173 RepID=UPI0003498917|nr:hypothetical protein [Pseudanabaena sp. PCC 6802]